MEKLLRVSWEIERVLYALSRELRPRSAILGCAAGRQVSPPCPGDPQVAAARYELFWRLGFSRVLGPVAEDLRNCGGYLTDETRLFLVPIQAEVSGQLLSSLSRRCRWPCPVCGCAADDTNRTIHRQRETEGLLRLPGPRGGRASGSRTCSIRGAGLS